MDDDRELKDVISESDFEPKPAVKEYKSCRGGLVKAKCIYDLPEADRINAKTKKNKRKNRAKNKAAKKMRRRAK